MHDSQVAQTLIDQVSGEFLIADKGYDSEAIRDYAKSKVSDSSVLFARY